MQQIEEVINRQVAAYNAQQVEPCVACFADEAVIEREADGSRVAGRPALAANYAELFQKNPRNRCTILKRMIVGSHVVDEELIEGREGEGPYKTIIIYRVQGGLIQHARVLGKEPA